jgi:hypothetical protein
MNARPEDEEKKQWRNYKDSAVAKEIEKHLNECITELNGICAYLKEQKEYPQHSGFEEFDAMRKAFSSFRRGYRDVEVVSAIVQNPAVSIASKLGVAKEAIQKAKQLPSTSKNIILKSLEMKRPASDQPYYWLQDLFSQLKKFFNPQQTNKFDLFIARLENIEKSFQNKNDARFFLPKPPLPKVPRSGSSSSAPVQRTRT